MWRVSERCQRTGRRRRCRKNFRKTFSGCPRFRFRHPRPGTVFPDCPGLVPGSHHFGTVDLSPSFAQPRPNRIWIRFLMVSNPRNDYQSHPLRAR